MGCNCEPKKYSISMGCCEPVLGPIENYYTKYAIDKMLEEIESGITSGCCITPEEVDEKIDEAISGITPCDLSEYWTSAETQSAITEAVSGKVDTSDFNTYSGNVETALNGKVDATAYTPVVIDATLNSGSTNAVANSAITKAVWVEATNGTITGYTEEKFDNSYSYNYDKGVYYFSANKLYYEFAHFKLRVQDASGNTEEYSQYTYLTNEVHDEKVDIDIDTNTISFTAETKGDWHITLASFKKGYDEDPYTAKWGRYGYPASEASEAIHDNIYPELGALKESVNGKQDTLVSGTNIKTINNESLLGSGNLDIQSLLDIPVYKGSAIASVSINNPSGSENGYNYINGEVSFGAGYMVETKNREEAAFGVYNVSSGGSLQFIYSSGNTLFSVGNGHPQNTGGNIKKHNAFQIMQNGDIYIADTNDTTQSEAWEKPMVKLQDIIASLQSQINELRAQIQ